MESLDRGLPISYLKERRHKLAEKLRDQDQAPRSEEIRELADLQGAIQALEAVLDEIQNGC